MANADQLSKFLLQKQEGEAGPVSEFQVIWGKHTENEGP